MAADFRGEFPFRPPLTNLQRLMLLDWMQEHQSENLRVVRCPHGGLPTLQVLGAYGGCITPYTGADGLPGCASAGGLFAAMMVGEQRWQPETVALIATAIRVIERLAREKKGKGDER